MKKKSSHMPAYRDPCRSDEKSPTAAATPSITDRAAIEATFADDCEAERLREIRNDNSNRNQDR